VQSVALRIIVDREVEIERFKPQEYWSVGATMSANGESFSARLSAFDGKKLQKRLDIPNAQMAARLRATP
jgi:DNA topoisomerase-1